MFLLHDFCNFQKNAWSEEEKNYTLKHKRSLSIFEKYTVTDRSWLTQCNFVGANTWHFILQFSFQVCIKNSTKKIKLLSFWIEEGELKIYCIRQDLNFLFWNWWFRSSISLNPHILATPNPIQPKSRNTKYFKNSGTCHIVDCCTNCENFLENCWYSARLNTNPNLIFAMHDIFLILPVLANIKKRCIDFAVQFRFFFNFDCVFCDLE